MIVVVIRTRMRPQIGNEYGEMACHKRARQGRAGLHPSQEIHRPRRRARDRGRVRVRGSIGTLARATQSHGGKRRGYAAYFAEFRFQICEVLRSKSWSSPPAQKIPDQP